MIVLNNEPGQEKELFKNILPSNIRSGIEVGVLFGDTSLFFLQNFIHLRLGAIDPLIPDSMESSLIGNEGIIMNRTRLYSSRFIFIKDYSFNVLPGFTDNFYDFVFIDGSHLYEDVKKDYYLCRPKVKHGGHIFFHDSRMNRGGAPFHPGPSRLVDELIANDFGLELCGEAFSLTAFKKL